jgi:hypothetical protein
VQQKVPDRHRFDCVKDPSGNWMVWDRTADAAAEHNGALLWGLDEAQARSLCALLDMVKPDNDHSAPLSEANRYPRLVAGRGRRT